MSRIRRPPRKPPVDRSDRAPREANPDDRSLFRESIGEVDAWPERAEAPRAAPPRPAARMSEADEQAVVGELLTHPIDAWGSDLGDPLKYLKDGVSPKLLRQLGRGAFAVREEFDLHQMTVPVAERALSRFLDESIRDAHLCVRVVHGKGLRSGSRGPVLRAMVDRMLRRRGDVLAFRSAQSGDGGSGAVVVLLKPRH